MFEGLYCDQNKSVYAYLQTFVESSSDLFSVLPPFLPTHAAAAVNQCTSSDILQ